MDVIQFLKDNKDLLKINQIEKDLGASQSLFSKAITDVQPLSERWKPKIEAYLKERFKTLID